MGKKIKGGKKKEKKKIWGKYNSWQYQIIKLISKTQFDNTLNLTIPFYCFMGIKIIDYKRQCDAAQGRKSNARGGDQKGLNIKLK